MTILSREAELKILNCELCYNNKSNKRRLLMIKAIFLCFILIASSAKAADETMIDERFVQYFKSIPSTSHTINLKITIKDLYENGNNVETELSIPVSSFPDILQRSYVVELEPVRRLIGLFKEESLLRGLELKASMWVEAPDHKEKVNGFSLLKVTV